MSNEPPQGGTPGYPPHGSDGRAEDGYPTEQMPTQPPHPGQHSGQGYPPQEQPGQYGQGQQPGPGYSPQGQPGQYPQGQSGQYPPQGQPGPYPQQGQQPGYPGQAGQYGPSHAGQYGTGYPQQGQYQQQGYGGAFDQPPKKSNTGMVVAIIAIVVALILGGVVWFVLANRSDEATPIATGSASAVPDPSDEPTQEPTEAPTTEATEAPTEGTGEPSVTPTTTGGQVTRPTEPPVSDEGVEPAPGTPPAMPSTVGDFKSLGTPNSDLNLYTDSANTSIVAVYLQGVRASLVLPTLEDRQEVGDWTCGVVPDSGTMCVADAWDGVVTAAGEADATTIAEFGKQLLATWK